MNRSAISLLYSTVIKSAVIVLPVMQDKFLLPLTYEQTGLLQLSDSPPAKETADQADHALSQRAIGSCKGLLYTMDLLVN
ncbi:hypothetical protein C0J52_09380 [Blattella germanica]|nr:hypothetical protein C0J52_09380 [Blattella germanica]